MQTQRRLRKESGEAHKISILLGNTVRRGGSERKTVYHLMNQDPAKLSLSNFLAGESNDPLQAPASFTNWMRVGAWAVELYEPELLGTADARTVISYGGKARPGVKLCLFNYFGPS